MRGIKPRKFIKYVALDERDNVLWGTMDNSPAQARARFDGFNPDPLGDTFKPAIREVTILLKT